MYGITIKMATRKDSNEYKKSNQKYRSLYLRANVE